MSEEQIVQIGRVGVNKPKKGVYIKTYGCQMNEYDTQKLYKILEDSHVKVEDPESADLVLVNTCSVREKPEHKLYSLLGRLGEFKQDRPNMLVGVGGCVAQQEGNTITKNSKVVDFVFGTHNLSLVPGLIDQRLKSGIPQVAVDYREDWEDIPVGFHDANGSRVSVFVSISRGCNKNCTYCIVPTTRGKEVSRDPSEILREVKIAVHRGAKEVVLLGQTVNSYGLDFKPKHSFALLLQKISEVDGLERIRFTSPHPQSVKDDFIDLVVENPKVCKHIHMPLQSGSDRILKLMNRNYRRKRFFDIIDKLKSRVPDIGITTDIIVGFPTETEEDFEETLDVMRRVEFQNSYSFMFSPRPGTKAAEMEDDIPLSLKKERLQRLQALQGELSDKSLDASIGTKVELLIEGPSSHDKKLLTGRTSQNVVLNLEEYCENLGAGDIVCVSYWKR